MQVIALAGFTYTVHQADLAMDKSGVGDVELWSCWSNIAAVFFWCGVGAWVFTFQGVAFEKLRNRPPVFFELEGRWGLVGTLIMLPPFAFIALMFASMMML